MQAGEGGYATTRPLTHARPLTRARPLTPLPLAIARPATSKHAQAKAPSTTFGKSRPLRVQAYTPVADASIAICLRVVAPPCKDASANRTNQTQHIRFAKTQKH